MQRTESVGNDEAVFEMTKHTALPSRLVVIAGLLVIGIILAGGVVVFRRL
ncbi:MAG: hypothetical protein ACPGLY_05960 [Rubripirellula sp.]